MKTFKLHRIRVAKCTHEEAMAIERHYRYSVEWSVYGKVGSKDFDSLVAARKFKTNLLEQGDTNFVHIWDEESASYI